MKKSLLVPTLLVVGFVAGLLAPRWLPESWAFPSSCVPGDINGDTEVDISDPVALLQHLFTGGEAPSACEPVPLPSRQVILVRHAERDPGGNAPLNAAGQIRAEALAWTLREAGIDALFSSDLLRSRQTIEPLAEDLGLEIEEIPTDDLPSTQVARDFVERVLALPPGSRVVSAQHSFTIPPILDALGVPDEQRTGLVVSGSSYENLLVIDLPVDGEPDLLWMRYSACAGDS